MAASAGATPTAAAADANARTSGFATPSSSEMQIASTSSSTPVARSLRRWISDGPFVSTPVRSPAACSRSSVSRASWCRLAPSIVWFLASV